MSPNNKKKLAIIRKKLDLLDNRFFQLIKIRTKLVKEVLKLKEFKNEIIDKKRINQILNNIKKKSYSNKIDSKITKPFTILSTPSAPSSWPFFKYPSVTPSV